MRIEVVATEADAKAIILEAFEAARTGELFKRKPENVYILTLEQFHRLFSPERVRILRHLRAKPAGSISELARSLERRFEAVHRDLKQLERHGLVSLEKREQQVVPVAVGRVEITV